MPKERGTLLGMLKGDEPGLIARVKHDLSGRGEGDWGEDCLAKLLKNRVSGAEFFRNVYVPVEDRTAELDVVMALRSGVYVFESKAYGGRICGRADALNWTQYLGTTKTSFYNPVKQNENHCRSLSRALQIYRDRMVSFIVFENRADLTKVSPKKGKTYIVCSRRDLPALLEEVLSSRKPVLSENGFQRVCGKLREWQNPALKERHIRQVQQRMRGDTCPLCGKKLTKRTGRNGAFLGCAGYPDCRYTRAAPEEDRKKIKTPAKSG